MGLPFGIQYTLILAPLFFFQSVNEYGKVYKGFVLISGLYLIAHFFNDHVGWYYYYRSMLLHFLTLIQVIWFYDAVNRKPEIVLRTFDKVVIINSWFFILAILTLSIGYADLFWEVSKFSRVGLLPRFRLFTIEPSYYSMAFAPILFFFIVKRDKPKVLVLLVALFASLSFGVLGGIILSLLILFIKKTRHRIDKKKLTQIGYLMLGVFVIIVIISFLFPENIVFVRLGNILTGNDSSARGRISEPWLLANKILKEHGSYLFGVGWGQIRELGQEIIRSFYSYTQTPTSKFGLPNVLTEILTIFGYVGLVIVLAVEIVLYRITNVSKSDFRFLIFWFIFIYQFTGSYSSSVLFYCYWVLAFSSSIDKILAKDNFDLSRKKL
ncbi:hypothetical protein KFE94_03285 [bacterium SCSIO 12643]|nr:hypothetical protein KFE94_03285 [bacterium SCSIO 12643]